jgi:hypothetical protein
MIGIGPRYCRHYDDKVLRSVRVPLIGRHDSATVRAREFRLTEDMPGDCRLYIGSRRRTAQLERRVKCVHVEHVPMRR